MIKNRKRYNQVHYVTKKMLYIYLVWRFIDKEGIVEDAIMNTIYVPVQEINAELKISKNILKTSGQRATLIPKNYRPSFLNLGTYYTIEKKVADTCSI